MDFADDILGKRLVFSAAVTLTSVRRVRSWIVKVCGCDRTGGRVKNKHVKKGSIGGSQRAPAELPCDEEWWCNEGGGKGVRMIPRTPERQGP